MLPFSLQYFLTPFFILHFETSKVTQPIKKMNFLFLCSPVLRYCYRINNIIPEDTIPSQFSPFPKFLTCFKISLYTFIYQSKLKFPHISVPLRIPSQNFTRNSSYMLLPGFSPFLVILGLIFL